MDGIVKAVVALVVGLVVLRMLANLVVGLADVSDIGCPPQASGAASVVVRLATLAS